MPSVIVVVILLSYIAACAEVVMIIPAISAEISFFIVSVLSANKYSKKEKRYVVNDL